ncbi:NAD-dependent deacetylase sirtuin-2 [Trichoderma longibrachiatum]|uniref:NAD-dependent deacetylase sirtuin-2 n=1 Tax=Trichoderma longibrachiatum ATCC 18648 TaxID=983965 RepID=A0A2T4C5F2_TRILO|nr:NAD-dependent deacetylase sirtuin-2 [Trichoderma longibrachiatum ATCC 18648]
MGQEESTPSAAYGPPATLQERSLEAVAEHIKSGKARRIVVMTGAGISTAAGIPDFRSPKTGLYSNLARLNLPYAEAVFDIAYFRKRPEPFYVLAQELYPGKFHPTISHAFIALLAEKGLLQMLFTQNIDCLERAAGVPADKIVEAHGSFATQRCIECKFEFPDEHMRAHVLRGDVPRCGECKGLVKPDITFFGEALPRAFSEKSHHTVMADLVLVIGTSLTVYPFASLPDMARKETPRVLFNMEKVGSLGSRSDDVLELGACDDGVRKLAELLGWTDELHDYWRNLVGDEEADRQLRSQMARDEEIEDELQKLTGDIETILQLEKDDDEEEEEEERKEEEERVEEKSAEGAETPSYAPISKDEDANQAVTTEDTKSAKEETENKTTQAGEGAKTQDAKEKTEDKASESAERSDTKPQDKPSSSTSPEVQDPAKEPVSETSGADGKEGAASETEEAEKPQQT